MDIARTFGITVTGAGALAMLTQAGTALGQFSFVPLGDIQERRRLMYDSGIVRRGDPGQSSPLRPACCGFPSDRFCWA